jgi:hypothetical protein
MNEANEWIIATVEKPEPYKLVLAVDNVHYTLAYVGEFWSGGGKERSLLWCIPGIPNARPKVKYWQELPQLPDEVKK